MAVTRQQGKAPNVLSSTSLHITLDLQEVPVEYEYDPGSGDVTAFNNDLRVMAIGRSPAEAEAKFIQALMYRVLAELRAGRALPGLITERIADQPTEPSTRSRRGALVPA